MNNNRKKKTQTQTPGEERLKSFLDMIAPSVIQFYTDHYSCGNTFRSVWALREYPTATDEQAILRHLGEKAVSYTHLDVYKRQAMDTGRMMASMWMKAGGNLKRNIIRHP